MPRLDGAPGRAYYLFMKRLLVVILALLPLGVSAVESSEARVQRTLPFRGKHFPDRWMTGDRASPEVGLYVGKGAWEAGKEHMKMFLKEHGHSYRTLTAADILGGELAKSGVETLMMPGGESWEYLAELGEAGAQMIRGFVSRGGGYFGVCAGAFYATSMREGGPVTGPYGIGLLDGTAYDGTALGTSPFVEGMMDVDAMHVPLMSGLLPRFRIVMFGGPSFRFSESEAKAKDIEVLMRFQKIREPAMITLHYGNGRVFLSGPHLEIEEGRTDWGPQYKDPDSEWPIMERAVVYLGASSDR